VDLDAPTLETPWKCAGSELGKTFQFTLTSLLVGRAGRILIQPPARAVPARSRSLGRGGPENSRVFTPDEPLRTGTVRGPAVAVSGAPGRARACGNGCRFSLNSCI